MHYADTNAILADAGKTLQGGPVGLIFIEDDHEVASTLAHMGKLGFGHLIAVCNAQTTLPDDVPENLHRLDCDVTADGILQTVINSLITALPGAWLSYCFNAEYIFFPFCEHRSVPEMLHFMQEERRDTVMSYIVDLYAADLGAHPSGVDRESACFDKSGYYALARKDALGEVLDRQLDISGGLRWRFEEHIARDRRRVDRVTFFRAQAGLEMQPDRTFNIAEYNTHSCPWHNNLTAAVASFRTAKALRRNPGSRGAISSFHWSQSERFDWSSQQLLDCGMMEPGQWF